MDGVSRWENLLEDLSLSDACREALVCGSDRITFEELAAGSQAIEGYLREQGVERGDAVTTVFGNSASFIATFFALLRIGAVIVPCDTAVGASVVESRMYATSSAFVMTDGAARDDVASFLDDGLQRAPSFAEGRKAFSGIRLYSRKRRVARPLDFRGACLVCFTSGSTGDPKGALLTVSNLFEASQALAERIGLDKDDVVLAPLPLSHMFGIVTELIMPLISAAKVVLVGKFDARACLELVQEERVTVQNGVPTMLSRELAWWKDHPDERPDLSSWRTGIVAGAMVPRELIVSAQEELGCSLAIAYGSTETVNISCGFPSDPLDVRSRFAGMPSEGSSVRVVDEDGIDVEPGQPGDLYVKGPGMMAGYLGDGARSDGQDGIDLPGWFWTGDRACLTAEGYLNICGRKKDLIIRGGNNVVPAKVESALISLDEVLEACVVGVPDPDLGEAVVAFVTVAPSATFDEEGIRERLKKRIPRFAVPDRVIQLERFPYLPNGKVDKVSLKERLREHGQR